MTGAPHYTDPNEAALDRRLDALDQTTLALSNFELHHHYPPAPEPQRLVPKRNPVAAIGLVVVGQVLLGATIAGGVDPLLGGLTSGAFGLCGLALVAAQRAWQQP